MSNQTEAKRELSRAERIRARRKTETPKGKSQPMASQRLSHAQPAVKVKSNTARNPFARPVTDNRRQNHSIEGVELTKPSVNRRITIPLNQQGAEIEFSTLPVMNMGWRLLSAVVTAAAVAGLIFLIFTTRVEMPQIQGLSPLLTAEVKSYLNLEGTPLFLIQPALLKEEIIAGFPEIETVEIDIQFPANVIITADARQPTYAWVIKNRTYLIDTEGIFYPAEPGTTIENLITIEAEDYPEMKMDFDRSEDIIVEILEYTNASGNAAPTPEPTFRGDSYTVDPSVIHALEQILLYLPSEAVLKYDQRHGFGWQDQRGWDAYFGFDLEQIDMKFAVYESIVKKVKYQGQDVSLISVEYLHAPYYRED
ncbi:MAG: hypothetical protein V2J07_10235 [Anaerolineae bacterium]|nr:hypothetical protein [Anaerolineae bacterium]